MEDGSCAHPVGLLREKSCNVSVHCRIAAKFDKQGGGMRHGQKKWVLAVFTALMILFISSLAFSGPPLKTGITFCTNGSSRISCPSPGQNFYGQDGCYQKGKTRSYTKLKADGIALPASATEADGWCMTRDNVTGLVWEVKTLANKDLTYTWVNANTYCRTLDHGGFSDWRLPTIQELSTLVDTGIADPGPTINVQYFPNTVFKYWSSSFDAYYDANYAWAVYFNVGLVWSDAVSLSNGRVRAVRAGQSDIFLDNGDGTVTDRVTGLMWQKDNLREGAKQEFTWLEALTACENLNLAGHTDWRLPNRNELQSLVDFSRSEPAIDTTVFPDSNYAYWSSSPLASGAVSAWKVNFSFGHVDTYGVSNGLWVRAVRTGESGSVASLAPIYNLLLLD
ncbi:MAG: DUF1566 domain-containing protein [Deltaproteobacteria bacterium]|nr:DUF1566 domain-containing protein [Deltaproteobacteria bacterium]